MCVDYSITAGGGNFVCAIIRCMRLNVLQLIGIVFARCNRLLRNINLVFSNENFHVPLGEKLMTIASTNDRATRVLASSTLR